jgi:frataxin
LSGYCDDFSFERVVHNEGRRQQRTKMDEQEFRTEADKALQGLYQKLASASDQYEFEPDFNSGALSIEFEEPRGKFVISPNTPVRQIWISAHSRSYKLDWNQAQGAFVLGSTGQNLESFIEEAISTHLGETVKLS